MKTPDLTSVSLLSRKKDTLLLKGEDGRRSYFIKAVSFARQDLVSAVRDEYAVMSRISEPCLPAYLACRDDFQYGKGDSLLALITEYIDGTPFSQMLPSVDLNEFISVLTRAGYILKNLLSYGVLYTDLNPGNILIRDNQPPCLVDFTGAYFFRHNPNPDYTLRFSYRLSPQLSGEQLLIQELALMLNMFLTDYEEKKEGSRVPSSVYSLLETGLHPTGSLSLKDYLDLLSQK